jgi:formyltetrahydrofolate-dependent phosphoribosylglycinamide formyltransferase
MTADRLHGKSNVRLEDFRGLALSRDSFAFELRLTIIQRVKSSTKKWAVLVSGSGTILESMLAEGLRPNLVVADRPGTRAIEVVAKNAGVPAIIIDRRKQFGYTGVGRSWRRHEFTSELTRRLQLQNIGLVAMAGFDTVLSAVIFDKFRGKIINTHPALLPAFEGLYGKHVIQATLDSGIKTAGCTIHVATEIVDDSSFIVAQTEVPVMPGDTVESLWERIKVEERKLYPRVLREILDGDRVLPAADVIIKQ